MRDHQEPLPVHAKFLFKPKASVTTHLPNLWARWCHSNYEGSYGKYQIPDPAAHTCTG